MVERVWMFWRNSLILFIDTQLILLLFHSQEGTVSIEGKEEEELFSIAQRSNFLSYFRVFSCRRRKKKSDEVTWRNWRERREYEERMRRGRIEGKHLCRWHKMEHDSFILQSDPSDQTIVTPLSWTAPLSLRWIGLIHSLPLSVDSSPRLIPSSFSSFLYEKTRKTGSIIEKWRSVEGKLGREEEKIRGWVRKEDRGQLGEGRPFNFSLSHTNFFVFSPQFAWMRVGKWREEEGEGKDSRSHLRTLREGRRGAKIKDQLYLYGDGRSRHWLTRDWHPSWNEGWLLWFEGILLRKILLRYY